MLRGSGLIGCDYKMMQSDAYELDEIAGVPTSPYIVREAGFKSVQGESTSRVRLGVFYTVRDMYSFLSEYFSSVVLVLHAIRCRAAQVE
jgi:hypothetical protein